LDFQFRNRILQSLPAESRQNLRLKPILLPVAFDLEIPGDPISRLFFLESGMASTTTTFLDGTQAEIAMSGIESIVGAGVLVGTRRSLNRVYMQIAGQGFSCTRADALAEFNRFSRFHDLCLRSIQAQYIQSAQTAGCNARHTVEQRLARWLLLCANRSGSHTFNVSQEFMADMIGNSRPTVSTVAGELQQQGFIKYQRGHLTILDPKGLERRSCECFRAVLDYLQNEIDWDNTALAATANATADIPR
jgi:CRP-like cAMP-binding protein